MEWIHLGSQPERPWCRRRWGWQEKWGADQDFLRCSGLLNSTYFFKQSNLFPSLKPRYWFWKKFLIATFSCRCGCFCILPLLGSWRLLLLRSSGPWVSGPETNSEMRGLWVRGGGELESGRRHSWNKVICRASLWKHSASHSSRNWDIVRYRREKWYLP